MWSLLTNRVSGDLDLNTTIVFEWVMGEWQMGKRLKIEESLQKVTSNTAGTRTI